MGGRFGTLYLHIGLEKTGTTSIQAFLARNTAALAARGVFVPRSLGHDNHKLLAAQAFEPGARDICVTSAGIGADAPSVRAFRDRLAADFADEARAALGAGANEAIVTSEDLSRLYSAASVGRVISMLAPWAERIVALVFLRRQDLLAASRYYSLVIGGSTQSWVLPGPNDPVPRYYDYAQTLGLWADALGNGNVAVVRFPEDPRAEGFNSVAAFCRAVGIDPQGLAAGGERHVSLDAVNQIIIREHNAASKGFSAAGMDQLIAGLRADNDPALRHVASAAQARAFVDRCRPGNDALVARFGPAAAFSDDFSMYPAANLRGRFQEIAIRRLLRRIDPATTGQAGIPAASR